MVRGDDLWSLQHFRTFCCKPLISRTTDLARSFNTAMPRSLGLCTRKHNPGRRVSLPFQDRCPRILCAGSLSTTSTCFASHCGNLICLTIVFYHPQCLSSQYYEYHYVSHCCLRVAILYKLLTGPRRRRRAQYAQHGHVEAAADVDARCDVSSARGPLQLSTIRRAVTLHSGHICTST